jgi:hypothetical protein
VRSVLTIYYLMEDDDVHHLPRRLPCACHPCLPFQSHLGTNQQLANCTR